MKAPNSKKYEVGSLIHLIVVPVGWLRAAAWITGGVRDVEVITRGILPTDLRDRLETLQPGEEIRAVASKSIEDIARGSTVWLTVEDGLVHVTNVPVVEALTSETELLSDRVPERDPDLAMWQEVQYDVRSSARYLGGPESASVSGLDHLRWGVQFTEKGLWIGQGLIRGITGLLTTLPTGGLGLVSKLEWSDVDFVWIADEGVSRARIAALATFGVLAVGARKKMTSVAISMDGGTSYFETPRSIAQWRAQLVPMMRDHPHLSVKIHLNTAYPGASQPVEPNEIRVALQRLEAFHNEGLVTDAEYEAKRTEILDRL